MQLQPLQRKSLKTGLITGNVIADSDYPLDACLESINMNFDTIGKATLRKGAGPISSLALSPGTSPITGLYTLYLTTAYEELTSMLLMVTGTKLYYGSELTHAWFEKRTGLTSGSKANFTTFLNQLFMVNGTEATAVWDGNTGNPFSTIGNALNAPIGRHIENFRSRVWIAGNATYPDRLYYSSIPSAAVTPTITWDTDVATGQWIDIAPSDGDNITALKRTKSTLLVFKRNHIYQVASISNADPDAIINVGTFCDRSIVEAKTGVYFHHSSGFYLYSNGSVQEISQPINDIVKGIYDFQYTKVAGWLEEDGNNICWEVGDIVINGVSYSNMVVRYTISTGVWTHYTYPTKFIASTRYEQIMGVATVTRIICGDDVGNVLWMNNTNTDYTNLSVNTTTTNPIPYSLIHAWDDFDNWESSVKKLKTLYFSHTGGMGSSVTWQTNEDDTNDWSKKVCELKQFNTGVNSAEIKGRKLHFKISGVSIGEPFSYDGFEVLDGTTEIVTFT